MSTERHSPLTTPDSAKEQEGRVASVGISAQATVAFQVQTPEDGPLVPVSGGAPTPPEMPLSPEHPVSAGAVSGKLVEEEAAFMSDDDPLRGVIVGNLRIEEKVGQGGWGAVYRAVHTRLQSMFAVKVLNAPMKGVDAFVERFEREARTLVQLKHPGIVQVTDCGELPRRQGHYLVMEFLEGCSLADAIERGEVFSISRISSIVEQICDALCCIQQKGIVHRDLKPSNIFLLPPVEEGAAERVKLIDFGIATIVDESSLTMTGACLGSPKYMSPEQAEGRAKDVDGRADIYALGIILFELLTGVLPFQGEQSLSLLRQQAQAPPPRLKDVRPDQAWAAALEALLKRTLAKKPEKRPADAKEFWAECQLALEAQAALCGPEHQKVAAISARQWGLGLGLIALFSLGGLWVFSFGVGAPSKSATPARSVGRESSTPERSKPKAVTRRADRRQVLHRRAIATRAVVPVVSRFVIKAARGTVVWDGQSRLGVVPYTLKGPPGKSFHLRLQRRGYVAQKVQVVLPQRGSLSRTFVLQAKHKQRRHRRPAPRKVQKGGLFDGVDRHP